MDIDQPQSPMEWADDDDETVSWTEDNLDRSSPEFLVKFTQATTLNEKPLVNHTRISCIDEVNLELDKTNVIDIQCGVYAGKNVPIEIACSTVNGIYKVHIEGRSQFHTCVRVCRSPYICMGNTNSFHITQMDIDQPQSPMEWADDDDERVSWTQDNIDVSPPDVLVKFTQAITLNEKPLVNHTRISCIDEVNLELYKTMVIDIQFGVYAGKNVPIEMACSTVYGTNKVHIEGRSQFHICARVR